MRPFAIGAALAVLGLAFASRADAQVIGTYGTPNASLGYYSPYPGALYSPFRQPPPLYYGGIGYGYGSGYGYGPGPGFYQPGFNGYAMPRYYQPPVYPQYGPGYSYRRW
jgi:hypothetical protein